MASTYGVGAISMVEAPWGAAPLRDATATAAPVACTSRTRSAHFALLAIAVRAMGLYPKPFTDVMQVSVDALLKHVAQSKLI